MQEMTAPAPPARPRIVLVDDDVMVRRSCQLTLQGCGYDVRAHSSPVQALVDPAIHEALCLITEFRMVGMDGVTLVRRLRANGWTSPAILVTAHRAAYVAAAQGDEIFVEVLEKPLPERRLIASVDRATGRV
ncbi:response regulator [Sphingobium yanoikuyae]|jgi:FixJ family two-component response regulator|uniref:response regulator n=2 Tax=Sphingobium TaxID=165695 RepID=UPI00243171BA|nr:response regulator [Sphingobium yanoikuyae]